jgi:large subunit ribosomal protein L6
VKSGNCFFLPIYMSRIGKTPINITKDVTVTMDGNVVTVKAAKGELSMTIPNGITVRHDGDLLLVANQMQGKSADALYGYVRAQLSNNVMGVTQGWQRELELSGVGYRATVEGQTLVLTVGFSHAVKIEPPPGIAFAVKEGKIVVSGIDKQMVGQTAAKIREVKKPEPYKGKGIKYVGEHIRKKAGKSAKAVGGTTTA